MLIEVKKSWGGAGAMAFSIWETFWHSRQYFSSLCYKQLWKKWRSSSQ